MTGGRVAAQAHAILRSQAASQIFTVRSLPAEAIRRPSGLKTTLITGLERPPKVWTSRLGGEFPELDRGSQRLAEATARPSGEHATPKI